MNTIALHKTTLGSLLDQTVSRFHDKEAVVYVDSDVRQTWSSFAKDVDTIAKGLIALGIRRGDKVAVWSKNIPHWLTMMFATAKIGAIMVMVNTKYRDTELLYILEQSECEVLCIADCLREYDPVACVYRLVPELRDYPRGAVQSSALPYLRHVLVLGEEKHRGMLSLSELRDGAASVSEELYASRKAAVAPSDVVNMQYTSGTTGFPKGVMLTHTNIVVNGYWIGANQRLSHKDTVCLPVPLFHCFGCVLGVMACVNHGTKMAILETFSPLQVMHTVEQEQCTALYGVPSMFQALLEHTMMHRFDTHSLRTGIMAGSVCHEPLMRAVMERLHLPEITICYGLTEASPVMTQTLPDDALSLRVETVGKAMPEIEVIILDPHTFEELPRGEAGEICCRGYNVMRGYYNMPEATAEAIDAQGWLHSGDLGTMDAQGYVRIVGRIKDMIIRGGENVYPREVEEFLLHMEGVRAIQVVGVPSRRYGEEVGAFLLTDPNADITPEDVRDFCRGRIAWFKVPRYVAVVSSFPMTASGKVQKYKLRELAATLFPEAMQERAVRGKRSTHKSE